VCSQVHLRVLCLVNAKQDTCTTHDTLKYFIHIYTTAHPRPPLPIAPLFRISYSINRRRYISTRTQSQRIVLKEGILFARGPVLQYQKEIESSLDIDSEAQAKRDGDDDDDDDADYDSAEFIKLPAPSNYGQMLQKLFDANIIFPTDRNENGSHQNKKVFVRGCSFPDYAEFEMWPADSTDGASVRYGFPGIADLTLEAKVEKMMGSGAAGSGTSTRRRRKKKTKPKKKNKEQSNPFVMEVESLRDLREEVVDPEKDAILFVTAPYCKLCR
jgi:hypothetical protein